MAKANSKVVSISSKGRDEAMIEAVSEVDAIFSALIAFGGMEYGKDDDAHSLPGCDSNSNGYIIRALAIRGHDVNDALISVLNGNIQPSQLDNLVRFGIRISFDTRKVAAAA